MADRLIATYRLQLTPDFGFDQAREQIDYFRRLGVSHLYLSPITEARAGSTHGYDVTDHNTVRRELGGEEAFERLRQACVDQGLGIILDFVPNHAGVGPQNEAWQDMLAYGPHSRYAHYFDVDFAPLKPELRNKVLLPFLGRMYGECLDEGEISIVWENHRLSAAYYDQRYALNPFAYRTVLEAADDAGAAPPDGGLIDDYRSLAPENVTEAEALRRRFADWADACGVQPYLEALTGQRLHQLLEVQYWRLAYWKTASYEVNYRRFFDINSLVALRMENPDVFHEAHQLLKRLLAREGIDGVRIDHVDGLRDPGQYLRQLRELGARHVWVEKILGTRELLPEDWPVDGTTGYQLMNDVVRLFAGQDGERMAQRLYLRNGEDSRSYSDIARDGKHLVMETMLSGELLRLAWELARISEADYHTRDFTLEALRDALAEMVACFPRYRTYLPEQDREEAAGVIAWALGEARRRSPARDLSVFDFLEQIIQRPVRDDLEPVRASWVGRFQQYCAPVAAKGVEDTAFYRYARFVCLNEVGGEPDQFSLTAETFHAHARFRAHSYPTTLVATATHDHKRGEDTRMRMVALSELGERWQKLQRPWKRAVRRHAGAHGPSPTDAWLFQQTLLALWGTDNRKRLAERLADYAQKAAREAKLHTSWAAPRSEYETDLDRFVRRMTRDGWVRRAVEPLAREMARYGFTHSVSQVIIKLTTPGVPDIYQGSELLDFSLVDPDNRRRVDWDERHRLLAEIESMLKTPDVGKLQEWYWAGDERLKMFAIVRLLKWRRQLPEVFAGSYLALDVECESSDHWVAYARGRGESAEVVVVLPRVCKPDEARLQLPETAGGWVDVFSGEPVASLVELPRRPLPWGVFESRSH